MERRTFFKNLIGGGAALTIAPQLFSQIVEHDYSLPNTLTILPEKVFTNGEGFWVFWKGELVAWSEITNANIHWKREIHEYPESAYYKKEYKEFYPGVPSCSLSVDYLHIKDAEMFNTDDLLTAILVKPGIVSIEGEVYCTYCPIQIINNLAYAEFEFSGAITIDRI